MRKELNDSKADNKQLEMEIKALSAKNRICDGLLDAATKN